MFADAEVEIAARVVFLREGTVFLDQRLGGRREIGGAADQIRQCAHERLEHITARSAGGDGLACGELRQERFEIGGEFLREEGVPLRGLVGIPGLVRGEEFVPLGFLGGPLGLELGKEFLHAVGDEELLVLGPTEIALGGGDFFRAERIGVGLGLALQLGRTLADDRLADDDGGLALVRGGFLEGSFALLDVVAVDLDHVPVVGLETQRHVVAVGDVSLAFDADLVVVVEPDEIVETEVTGERGGLVRDAFFQVAVGNNRIDVVIADGEFRRVKNRSEMLLRNSQTDRIARALAERPGGDFNALSLVRFRVAGSLAAPLAEILELVERDVLETGQVQQGINQHRTVSGGQDETVAIGPMRIDGIELEELGPQHNGEIGATHRQAGVTGLGFFHRIDGQRANRVGGEFLNRNRSEKGLIGHKGAFIDNGIRPVEHSAPPRAKMSCDGNMNKDSSLCFFHNDRKQMFSHLFSPLSLFQPHAIKDVRHSGFASQESAMPCRNDFPASNRTHAPFLQRRAYSAHPLPKNSQNQSLLTQTPAPLLRIKNACTFFFLNVLDRT